MFREANSSPGAKLKDRKKTVYVASQLRAESLPVSTSGWVSELGRRKSSPQNLHKRDGWKLFQICARHPGANSTKLGAQTKLSAAVYADVKPINLGRKTNRYVNLLLSLLKQMPTPREKKSCEKCSAHSQRRKRRPEGEISGLEIDEAISVQMWEKANSTPYYPFSLFNLFLYYYYSTAKPK